MKIIEENLFYVGARLETVLFHSAVVVSLEFILQAKVVILDARRRPNPQI